MFACVECAGRVEVQEVLLQLPSVAGNGSVVGLSGGGDLVGQEHGHCWLTIGGRAAGWGVLLGIGGVWGSEVGVAGQRGVTCSPSVCPALVGSGLVPVLLVAGGGFLGGAALLICLSLICASGAGERSGKLRLISPRSLRAQDLIPASLTMSSASGNPMPIMGAALTRIRAGDTGKETRQMVYFSPIATKLACRSLTTSCMALSCSVVCQHICDVWLGQPQDWHVLPNAGHWVLLMAVLALVLWPGRPEKQHAVLLFGCGVGVVGGHLGVADRLGLWGVALGGGCCCWRLYPLCSASPWSASSSMALLLAWGGVVIVVNDCLPETLTIINCTSSWTVWSLSGSFNRSAWMSGSARPTHS